MHTPIDLDVFLEFVHEAQAYLPTVRQGIDDMLALACSDSLPTSLSASSAIEESYRYCHSIHGVAAMLGLDEIRDQANQLELHFEKFLHKQLIPSLPALEQMLNLVQLMQIEFTEMADKSLSQDQLECFYQTLLEKRSSQNQSPVSSNPFDLDTQAPFQADSCDNQRDDTPPEIDPLLIPPFLDSTPNFANIIGNEGKHSSLSQIDPLPPFLAMNSESAQTDPNSLSMSDSPFPSPLPSQANNDLNTDSDLENRFKGEAVLLPIHDSLSLPRIDQENLENESNELSKNNNPDFDSLTFRSAPIGEHLDSTHADPLAPDPLASVQEPSNFLSNGKLESSTFEELFHVVFGQSAQSEIDSLPFTAHLNEESANDRSTEFPVETPFLSEPPISSWLGDRPPSDPSESISVRSPSNEMFPMSEIPVSPQISANNISNNMSLDFPDFLDRIGQNSEGNELSSQPQLNSLTEIGTFATDLNDTETINEGNTPTEELTDIPPELMEIFQLEAEEHLERMQSFLKEWQQKQHRDALGEIRRSAHTVKGSAAMVGLKELSRFAHRLEDIFDQLVDGTMTTHPELIRTIQGATDCLDGVIHGGTTKAFNAWYPQLDDLEKNYRIRSNLLEHKDFTPADKETEKELPQSSTDLSAGESLASNQDESGTTVTSNPNAGQQYLRVPVEKLDQLSNSFAEWLINRSSLENYSQRLESHMKDMQQQIDHLKNTIRQMESKLEAQMLGGSQILSWLNPRVIGFDSLEMDRYNDFHIWLRRLNEASQDLQRIGEELILGHQAIDHELHRDSQQQSLLRDQVTNLRMVPLQTLVPRLERIVRTTAHQLHNKEVKFEVEGQQTTLDKTVLEAITEPLLHLLRNAVDHGIESSSERIAQQKPPSGTIRFQAYQDGTQVVLKLSDDGRGIDPDKLANKALQLGIATATEMASWQNHQFYDLLFLPGFSTAQKVSEISGRGVGLDVVRTQIERYKGVVSIESQVGQGTTFEIRLPLTVATMKVLLVRIAEQIFAIPMVVVRAVDMVDEAHQQTIETRREIIYQNQTYPVLDPALYLYGEHTLIQQRTTRLVLMEVRGQSFALMVEQLLGVKEIVIKPLQNIPEKMPAVFAGAILGDGSVGLIMQPAAFLTHLSSEITDPANKLATTTHLGIASKSEPRSQHANRNRNDEPLHILVVDDSASIRRITTDRLKHAQFKTSTARDGLDALESLKTVSRLPDLILLDVEMPRMDGYELLSALSGHANYRSIPVVMVTSRSGEKHRQKARELGAAGYLTKPFKDNELFPLITELTGQNRFPDPLLATLSPGQLVDDPNLLASENPESFPSTRFANPIVATNRIQSPSSNAPSSSDILGDDLFSPDLPQLGIPSLPRDSSANPFSEYRPSSLGLVDHLPELPPLPTPDPLTLPNEDHLP